MSQPKVFDSDDASTPTDDDAPISLEGSSPAQEQEAEPISLVDSDSEGGASQVRRLAGLDERMKGIKEFRRPVNLTGTGATRCRVFHTKISATSLKGMEDQINEWLDSEEIEVKHVGHNIGMLQGKSAEENLIVTIWY